MPTENEKPVDLTPLTPERIRELERIYAKTTPGPLTTDGGCMVETDWDGHRNRPISDGEEYDLDVCEFIGERRRENAEFFVAAHNDFPALCRMASEAGLRAERDALAKFKAWVHDYLDGKGIPHHPPGTHGAAGCRIGDRMDYVFAERDELRGRVMMLMEFAVPISNRLCTHQADGPNCGVCDPCTARLFLTRSTP